MDEFSTKELYSVQLKATSIIEIGGHEFLPGETVLSFDELQLSVLAEQKTCKYARGGYGNPDLINWDTTSSVAFIAERGVMSQVGLAILSNSKLTNEIDNLVEISYEEAQESNSKGEIQLKYTALLKEFFVYDNLGKPVTNYQQTLDPVTGKMTISNLSPYKEYLFRYLFYYKGQSNIMSVGHKLFNGYFKLTARMRLKDDTTGLVKTGIIEIPRVKLMSDLSMRLGTEVSPMVSVFRLQGDPIGERNKQYVCKIIYLDSDIDSDI